MTRTDALRIAKYVAKVTPTTIGLKVAAMLTGMKSTYAAVANDLQPIESQVQAVLDTNTVASVFRGGYYAYARELWKRKKLGGNPALDNDAQTIKTKWVSQGLTSGVCIAIASTVFGITVT